VRSFLPRFTPEVVAKLGGRLMRSRRLMRIPIWVYHARLGFLFGSRMLMLQHIGRKTGASRYVVLEVIEHPTPETYVVASGFGQRSDWFRNLEANGHARVYTGVRVAVPATARTLTASEADIALHAYIARHARAWNTLKPVIEDTLEHPISERKTKLPMVELRLTTAPDPPA
jgi:deazaflavin-dependent oxidoreductase (nitroreductase family)